MYTGDNMGDRQIGIAELGLEYDSGWRLIADVEPAAMEQLQRMRGGAQQQDEGLPFTGQDIYRVDLLGDNIDFLRQPLHNKYGLRLVGLINDLGALASEIDDNYSVVRGAKVQNCVLGVEHVSDGRLHMGVDIARPEKAADKQISQLATNVMQSFALRLEHSRGKRESLKKWKRRIAEDVFAAYSVQKGVTLTTSPVMGHSLETGDPRFYKPDSPVMHLSQHNIYNFQQQLILLSGAVAIAHADTLV